jgi:hypothetical protein
MSGTTPQSVALNAMTLFVAQLARHTAIKIVVAPTSIDERGVVAKVSMRKEHEQSRRPTSKPIIRLRLAIEGTAESQTGLDLALVAIEEINAYLKRPRNLEDASGVPIPNTRITQSIAEDDSMLDSPDGTKVQDVLDERTVTLFLS